ncbi:MAG: hypothetical protein B7Z73_06060 [Planctomycetia bacterium 21-64-5]|nr:MAG: hypothetical protein B7Z73_06060 [Planctomycetia bacterium 21-64-5]
MFKATLPTTRVGPHRLRLLGIVVIVAPAFALACYAPTTARFPFPPSIAQVYRTLASPRKEPFPPARAVDPDNRPTSFNLGSIRAGSAAEARIPLTNGANSWIEIANVHASCPCLSVLMAERRIAPRRTMYVTVRIDLVDEPDFTGGLCPELQLFDSNGRQLFLLAVNCDVVRENYERPVRSVRWAPRNDEK